MPPALDLNSTPILPRNDYPNRWKAFYPLLLVSIISTLDSSVVNVSLPVISRQLQADINLVEWVVMAYLLAITSLLVVTGRLGDMVGRRRVYQAGIVLFTASSALCGFAVNITMLIASRTLQGVGAALIVGNGPALIGEIFPPRHRGKALGILGTTVSVGLAIGPAVGGFITGYLGWRYIFFINLPLGALAAMLVKRNLPLKRSEKPVRFDLPGALTMSSGLVLLLIALSRGNEVGWSDTAVVAQLLIGLLLIGLFLWFETRAPDPILALSLFHNRTFSSATAAGFFAFAALFAQTFLLPFYLIQLRGFSPAHAGLFLMAVPSIMAIVAPTSGSLSDRIGSKGLSSVGLTVQGVSFILLGTLSVATPQVHIVAILLLLGLGIGMFNPPNNADLLSSVPQERLGNASAMMGLTRTVGMVFGVALSTTIFLSVRNYLLRNAGVDPGAGVEVTGFAFLEGLRWAFLVAAGLSWVGALVTLRREKRERIR